MRKKKKEKKKKKKKKKRKKEKKQKTSKLLFTRDGRGMSSVRSGRSFALSNVKNI